MLFEEEYRLRSNDFDQYDVVRPSSILDIFQNIAGKHAEEMGIGYLPLVKKNLGWVLTRQRISILKELHDNEILRVLTWPNEKGKVDFMRNYEAYDENGELVAKGMSRWCVISLTERKVMRTDEINYPGKCISKKSYDEKLSRITSVIKDDNISFSHKVTYSDLDHNFHMNNAKYADIILDALLPEKKLLVKDLQINYFHEARINDVINVFMKREEETIYFSGYIGDEECFSARIVF